MPEQTVEWIGKLLPGAGAALVAALILAPGGLLVGHLENTNTLRTRHTADWTAWSAALGLACNLLATITFLTFRALAPQVPTMLGASLSTYLLLLILTSVGLSVLTRSLFRALRRFKGRAGVAKAQDLLEMGSPENRHGAHLLFEYQTSDEQIRRLLLAVAQCAQEGWRVTVDHAGGKVTGVPYSVPDVLGSDPNLDGIILKIAGETSKSDSQTFIRWNSIRAIEIGRDAELPGGYRLQVQGSGAEKTAHLRRPPGWKFHEGDLHFELALGGITCMVFEAPAAGTTSAPLAKLDISNEDLEALEPGVPSSLKGASTITAVPKELRERLSVLDPDNQALQHKSENAIVLVRRIADRELRVWALVSEGGDDR